MKTKLSFIVGALCIALCVGCSKKEETFFSSENNKYIEEITSSNLALDGTISVTFTQDIKGNPLKALSFDKKIKGTWSTSIAGRTVRFVPSKNYKEDTLFTLKIDLKEMLGLDTQEDCIYKHSFIVEPDKYSVNFYSFDFDNETNDFKLNGKLFIKRAHKDKSVNKIISAKIGSKKLQIQVVAENEKNNFYFTIHGVTQTNKDQNLVVEWDGKKAGVGSKTNSLCKGKKSFVIPRLGVFSVLDMTKISDDMVIASFSKPLDTTQYIAGFVDADEKTEVLSSTIDNNLIRIYSDNNFEDIGVVSILDGIKSQDGMYLAAGLQLSVSDKWQIPKVEFTTKGTILPTTQGTILPIRTKNLHAVEISVWEIYNHNMVQFMQINDLDGNNDIRRVGEKVWGKRITFDFDVYTQKNKFVERGIDLSDLIKKFPNGMYQIRISFTKDDIEYNCQKGHKDFEELFKKVKFSSLASIEDVREDSNWNYADDFYNMPWEERRTFYDYTDDPCHPAFYISDYNPNALKTRNVLVSDIGIIAKKTINQKYYVAVTDLKTAKPISGADVIFYSYVGSKLYEGKTNAEGFLEYDEKAREAKFICAKNGNQESYIKLEPSTSLSVSHFETGGVSTKGGVKGFIYGERGIWRPGDDIFLTFVLLDENKALPKDIPVTFTLTDPLGRVKETKTLKNNVNGFYAYKTATNENDTTGLYTASFEIGGNKWTKSLSIESIMPNKLSVNLTSSEKILNSGKNTFTLKGAWLHGASAAGYKADVNVSFKEIPTAFNNFSEYTFSNPTKSIDYTRETIWEGTLSEDSRKVFNADLGDTKGAPGMLRANFTSRIFEPSGAFSTEQTSIDYSPYEKYVGVKLPKGDATRGMLLTDKDHTIDVVLLDKNGNFIKTETTLGYSIYKLEWKWWWEKDALTSAKYSTQQNYEKVVSGNINVIDGRGKASFNIKYPSWGRYLVEVHDFGAKAHSAAQVVYIDWPGWAGRSQEAGSGSAAMLPLICDKKNYSVGETAEISFASSKGGRALVTIEKNGSIIEQSWLDTKDETTIYKLKTTNQMAPNVYAHVTLLQEHLQTKNSHPIRLYGVVPVMVENPASRLTPVITMQEKFMPNSECAITVSEKNGKPMTYTIAVVDEGLLGLNNYHAPDIWGEFYKKEASNLLNWDLYSYVINAYSGKLETILALGGSDEIISNGGQKTNRFAPVVKYFGPFELGQGERKATRFEMPYYVGAVRAMVIAGNGNAFGMAEKSAQVKSDIMVQATLPKTVGLSEELKVPITVFNTTEKDMKIKLSLNCSDEFEILDSNFGNKLSQEIFVEKESDKIAYITIKANKEGNGELDITASSNGLTTKECPSLLVKSRGIDYVYKSNFVVNPKNTERVTVSSPGIRGTNKLSLELSTIPCLNLNERLEYLIDYPHGCIEQITSGGFPQLYLSDFIKLSPEQIEKTKKNVNSVIERYPSYQTPSGAFGYWPGNKTPNEWGSCYAAHFLLEAKKKGYTVPESIIIPLLNFIETDAKNWSAGDAYGERNYSSSNQMQSYRLFVLSLAGRPNLSAMNRLRGLEGNQAAEEGNILLSASYALAGKKDVASEILRGVHLETYRYTNGTYGSETRENAMYLFALNFTNDYTQAARLAKEVADRLASQEWLSTQEIVWSFLSLFPFYSNEKSSTASYSVVTNDNNEGAENGTIEEKIKVLDLSATDDSEQYIIVENTGKKLFYGTLSARGHSLPGKEVEQNNGITISVKYYIGKDEVNVSQLKKGTSFTIKLSVEKNIAKDKIENIALSLPIPTGWEFSNDRIGGGNNDDSLFDYQDIRDDVIHTYFNLIENDKVTFTFNSTVAYEGDYYIPAIKAEAMYDNNFSAIKPALHVKD